MLGGMTGNSRFTALPTLGAALLPKLTCAACWPAYAALLSSLGVGFFDYTPYLLPLTLGSVTLAVASLALLARRRRRVEPLALGVAGAIAIIVGKLSLEYDPLVYAGIAMFITASILPWKAKMQTTQCASCHGRANA
jgi:hypothetical protein